MEQSALATENTERSSRKREAKEAIVHTSKLESKKGEGKAGSELKGGNKSKALLNKI